MAVIPNYPSFPGIGISSDDGVGPSANVGELDTKHPEYQCKLPDWCQMRHTYSGQRAVKEHGTCYLPATSGMIEDGFGAPLGCSKGDKAYSAYLTRALFHGFVKEAVATGMGMLWNKPCKYEIPEEMEYLREKASSTGGGLEQLHRSVNRQQFITGRLGLLTDLTSKDLVIGQPRAYISLYYAESIVNWDAGFPGDTSMEVINLVVLNESGPRRDKGGFAWNDLREYRVLMLGDPEQNESKGTYKFGVFSDAVTGNSPAFDSDKMIEASTRGAVFDHIPFIFCNANSTESCPCDPPLLGLSDLCLAIYRLEADYRQNLFMQTQDTLFTVGFSDEKDRPLRTGAGSRIHSPVKGGDAKFIGINSEGLPELRTALENDIKRAASKAGEMMDASSRARESGDALEIRIGSKTATLNEIALNGGEAMLRALRDVARWMGLSQEKIDAIAVKPNYEFSSAQFIAMDFKALVESKLLGGPVSWAAIHAWSADRGGPGADLSFDQMMEVINAEVPFGDVLGSQVTPLEREQLDLQQEAQDQQAENDAAAAEAAKIAAKQPKPAPAAPAVKPVSK